MSQPESSTGCLKYLLVVGKFPGQTKTVSCIGSHDDERRSPSRVLLGSEGEIYFLKCTCFVSKILLLVMGCS